MIEAREFVGESLDGAIAKAGKHFGVEIERLSVKVLSDAMEISGVGVRVVILAAVQEAPSPPPADLGPAGEFLSGLLTRMGFSSPVIHEAESEDRIMLRIQDPRVLEMVRRDGRVRDALAHLVGRGVQKICGPDTEVRIQTEADEGGEERLEELAREKAREVADRGEEVLLPPMNSRDRWIVHDTLKSMTGVRTESVGDGRLKRVKIIPA